MKTKKVVCCGLVLMLGTMLAVVPAAAADESDVAGRAAIWQREFNAGNLAAVQALYADDACRMPPNEQAIHGKEAILANLKEGRGQNPVTIKIVVTSAESSGDLGYGIGTYEVTGPDGSPRDHGKWMLVSKKSHGTWKTQCDIFNSDIPR